MAQRSAPSRPEATFRNLVLAALFLGGCNSVFGLDEGHVASTGSGGAASTQGQGSATSMGSQSIGVTTGSQPTNSTGASMSTSGPGAGGGCTEDVGLKNEDFSLQDTESPQDWSAESDATMVNYSTISGLTTGLSMAFASIGANAHGGLFQTNGFVAWDHCVRLQGSSRRKQGSQGQLHAEVLLTTGNIEMDLPSTANYQSFQSICHLPASVDHFTLTVDGRSLPEGGTVTMEIQTIAFDEVCCTGAEPECGT
jgi:hypothetical protein